MPKSIDASSVREATLLVKEYDLKFPLVAIVAMNRRALVVRIKRLESKHFMSKSSRVEMEVMEDATLL